MRIKGTYSKLPFSGTVVGTMGNCLLIDVDQPAHKNLPLGPAPQLCWLRVLCFNPHDKNVTVEEANPFQGCGI